MAESLTTISELSPIFVIVSDEKKTGRQSVISSCSESVRRDTWRARRHQKQILVIDTEQHGKSALVSLTPQETYKFPSRYNFSNVYRITGIKATNMVAC